MATTLRNLLLKPHSNAAFWIVFAVIARIIYCLLELHFNNIDTPQFGLAVSAGDTLSYFSPIENLVARGSYDSASPMYRMPGYGAIYLPFLILFSKAIAYNVVVALQLILSGISIYALALTARLVFGKDFFFYATFYGYAISSYTAQYDPYLITESFTTSSLIFSVYYYVLYFRSTSSDGAAGFSKAQKKYLLLAGVFLTWGIFLRPTNMLLIIPFALFLFWHNTKTVKKSIIIAPLFFLAPFIVTESSWITCNWMHYKRFVPLTPRMFPTAWTDSPVGALYAFDRACGMDYWLCTNYWAPKPNANMSDIDKEPVPFPRYLYTSKFNRDSLKALRKFLNKVIIKYDVNAYSDSANAENTQIIRDKCNTYIQSVKSEKPYVYYFISYLTVAATSFIEAQYSALRAPVIGRIGWYLYYIVTFLGYAGAVITLRSFFKLSPYSVIPLIPLYTIFLNAVVFRLGINRYLVPGYPFLIICSVYAVYWFYCKKAKKPLLQF